MDLDNVPDLLLWTLFSLVVLDILRRISYGYWSAKLKTLFKSLFWPVYPEVQALVLQIGDSRYLTSLDPLPIHFPDCSSPSYISHLHKYRALTSAAITRLTGRYPRLTALCLTINNASTAETDYLTTLLSLYSPHLKYLILECNFATSTSSDLLANSWAIRQLIEIINTLPRLTHLSFEIANQLPPKSPPIPLPIFSQLQKFALYSHFNGLFAESFSRFGSNIQSVHLSNEQLDNSLSLTTTDPKIASRIVELSFRPFTPIDPKLDFICASFGALQFLKISLEQLYLARLVGQLAQLKSLVALDLEITSAHFEPISQSNRIPTERIARLINLKRLTLRVTIASHADLHSKHLGWIFPNLESLTIDHNYFTCSICLVDHFAWLVRLRNICKNEMVKPWREQCPALSQIQVYRG